MRQNDRGYKDIRRVFSGKDGAVFDEDGELLATVDSFQAQVTWTNADYNPLGDAQTHSHLLSYKVTLAITECIVESDKFLSDMFSTMKSGVPCWWTFQHDVKGWDGKAERVVYRDCVPDGQIDLANMQVGELCKRTINLVVNQPPELQKILGIANIEKIYDYADGKFVDTDGTTGYINY